MLFLSYLYKSQTDSQIGTVKCLGGELLTIRSSKVGVIGGGGLFQRGANSKIYCILFTFLPNFASVAVDFYGILSLWGYDL